jgi:hypothetical protein
VVGARSWRNNFDPQACLGEPSFDDYDVLADGAVVGRIMKSTASPVGATWLWTLAFRAS